MVVDSGVLEGGGCWVKKHSSLPPARRRRLKGCNISLYHSFLLPNDGNGFIWATFGKNGIFEKNKTFSDDLIKSSPRRSLIRIKCLLATYDSLMTNCVVAGLRKRDRCPLQSGSVQHARENW